MIKSRHDTAFFQRSYSSGLDRTCCMARIFDVILAKSGNDTLFTAISYPCNNADASSQ
ncbi:hypothetical protein [Rickettsia endosymbiont of Orchestes rusci]|uniref:hypothetical protein n=1 Tax=Rickettsia endosymbiont of Orchestes rusci TaxID=3066250 RepID=UPI00313B2B65